jgi:hypothetical protein
MHGVVIQHCTGDHHCEHRTVKVLVRVVRTVTIHVVLCWIYSKVYESSTGVLST